MQVRDEIAKFKVGAPARVGLVAPNDVTVPAGNTGLDPSQTSFFQVPLTPDPREFLASSISRTPSFLNFTYALCNPLPHPFPPWSGCKPRTPSFLNFTDALCNPLLHPFPPMSGPKARSPSVLKLTYVLCNYPRCMYTHF